MKEALQRLREYFTRTTEGRYLVVVLAMALIVFTAVLALPVKLIEPDDATYYAAMKAFAQGKLIITRSELMDFQREIIEKGLAVGNFGSIQYVSVGTGYALEKAPGYPFILAAFYRLGIERFVNLFFGLLALIVFYRMMSKAFGPRTALFSSIILLSNATFLAMFYRIYMSDFVSMALVLIGLGLYYLGLEDGGLEEMHHLGPLARGISAGQVHQRRGIRCTRYLRSPEGREEGATLFRYCRWSLRPDATRSHGI